MHMAGVRIYGSWAEFEALLTKVIVESRRVDGLVATWMFRSDEDPDVAYLATLWESREQMESHWRSEFYRSRILPRLIPRVIGEIPSWSGPISLLYSRLPARYRRPGPP